MEPADLGDERTTLAAAAQSYRARLLAELASPFPRRADLAVRPEPPRWAPAVPPESLADLLTDGPLQHVPNPVERRRLVEDGLAEPFLAEVVRSPALRAGAPARGAAALLHLGSRAEWAVIAGPTAWWVHTGCGVPATVQVHAATRHRGPDWLEVGQCSWCTADGPLAAEVEQVGGCAVTSPALTAADLLRAGDPHVARDAVATLLAAGLVTTAEVVDVLQRQSGAVRIRDARRLLAEAQQARRRGAQATVPWTGIPSAVTR